MFLLLTLNINVSRDSSAKSFFKFELFLESGKMILSVSIVLVVIVLFVLFVAFVSVREVLQRCSQDPGDIWDIELKLLIIVAKVSILEVVGVLTTAYSCFHFQKIQFFLVKDQY